MVPCTLTVNGVPELALSAACLDLDSIVEFSTSTDTLTIFNTGCDTLNVTNITNNLGIFSPDTTALQVLPGDSGTLVVTFAPVTVGTFHDTLQLFTDAGDTSICLSGDAFQRPVISIDPNVLNDTIVGCNDSITVPLTVFNTGGSDLIFSIGPPAASSLSLDSVLARLNRNATTITDEIPNRFDFSDGIFGTVIPDGGGDMYDSGNDLNTNLTTTIFYSDNTVLANAGFGTNGRYFTRKVTGLFVMAADLDGITSFEITGNLGADGFGTATGAVINHTFGSTTYTGFVKRVSGAGDPSVNHLIIIEQDAAAAQNFATNTDDDQHEVTGLDTVTRLYYLLYSSTAGGFITDAETQTIMNAFLESLELLPPYIAINPTTDTVAAGDSATVLITYDGTGRPAGTFANQKFIASNDPLNPTVAVPCTLTIIGTPEIELLPTACLDLDSIMEFTTNSDTFEILNAVDGWMRCKITLTGGQMQFVV
ncbi:MAG: DUF1573 domain-containing protein [Bacteroidota bacterium]